MKLTRDEHRALAFIAALLALSAMVRLLGLPEPVELPVGELDLAGHVEAVEAEVADEERRSRPLEPGEVIDPNTAPAPELDRLPGVGPGLADRIVADREARGPYRSLADLERVVGVGPRTTERLAPYLGLRTGPAAPRPGARVDLNRADAATLTTLPGVGPVLAARIVAYRDSVGPFRQLSDLEAVAGIGPATIVRIADRVLIK